MRGWSGRPDAPVAGFAVGDDLFFAAEDFSVSAFLVEGFETNLDVPGIAGDMTNENHDDVALGGHFERPDCVAEAESDLGVFAGEIVGAETDKGRPAEFGLVDAVGGVLEGDSDEEVFGAVEDSGESQTFPATPGIGFLVHAFGLLLMQCILQTRGG